MRHVNIDLNEYPFLDIIKVFANYMIPLFALWCCYLVVFFCFFFANKQDFFISKTGFLVLTKTLTAILILSCMVKF